ncbi:MAG: DUF1501 domain-containing protein [Acidimicrobiales bacterium]
MTDDLAPEATTMASLHPDCPDWTRLGPTPAEALLRARAARNDWDREQRDQLWSRGFTRRRFLAGAGMAGVASLGAQLVTTRASFAAATQSDSGTLIVLFLRGGMDGLSVVVPADDPQLRDARPDIAVPGGALLPLDRGFGLHPALAPLHELWGRGQFTAVPAVSTPDISRSHFQAQDCLERGGASTGTTEGWLDRVLDVLGPGTSFRSIAQGTTLPRSLAGDQSTITLRDVESFRIEGWEDVHAQTREALATLYTGLDHPLAVDVTATLEALDTVNQMTAEEYRPAATYPDNDLGRGLTELARLVKGDVGLRVASIDLGGWDMHTRLGTIDGGDMERTLGELGEALGAFATDLGDRLGGVTLVAMTEFGRRIEQNANAGADHGHGAVALLLGGGLAGRTIHGNWQGLAPEVRDNGDVPGLNDYRDVLGEVITARLGIGQGDLATVFPGHQPQQIGVMA